MTTETAMINNALSDEEVVYRILQGEKRLFELLIRKYNQRLYRIAMSVLQHEGDAEDAMQSAYINAYEHLPGFEGRSAFGTWLTRILMNECFALKRKKKLVLTGLQQPDITMNMKTPDRELANKELKSLLERAIEALPEKYRLVFVLREIESMSVRDTSELLQIEEPNVKVRLNRAKVMLRDSLGGHMQSHIYHFHLQKCDRMVMSVFARLGI